MPGAMGLCVVDLEAPGQVSLSLSVPLCKMGLITVFPHSRLLSTYCVPGIGCFSAQDPEEDEGDSLA